ncbi:hypothetical protein EW146_g5432 [Bondarzewia mesenterica]|uniref:Cation/H+ exchanger transmembrane domain-containing protein n=1 Tax=Bondarzewia mesenterica TaxID=1095465 RepID=A0A4S4LTL9_9AGAM|nr:hypothetical protein EW146_g5432 [Bondarzewia mesenterica]
MGEFSSAVVEVSGRLFRRSATEQAGIFAGLNPASFNSNDPFPLWVIQAVIIIGMSQLLSLFLSRIRQPRVIAEVIGGVILGPTVMGRIPNFTKTIFPSNSLPMLNLTSTIGLVLFLFLVGLEIDMRLVKRNAKVSAVVSIAGLVIPLGLGAALAIPLYKEFIDPSVNHGYFILFVAVAVGITAFPVLCRILTEVKLLDTTVGVVVLSAGVGNDVVGWILLALTVALVNASNGLTALYVLLAGLAYVLFLLFPVRWAFVALARRTGSLETGQPTALMMTVTLVIVLISAFYTDIIGGFLTGLIIPKENGFDIALVEKLEDLVGLLFLPQYFALSGLRTNLGLLNNGVTWGYTILICVVAFLAKFLPCSISAKAFGFNSREAGAIGTLMSCKGLVELIVLNVGLQAGVLNTRVFSMFVFHALVLTFLTTPLTIWVYPARIRVHTGALIETGHPSKKTSEDGQARADVLENIIKYRFAVVLDKVEQLPAVMTLTQLLKRPATPSHSSSITDASSSEEIPVEGAPDSTSSIVAARPKEKISLDALRLIELTERTSALLKSHVADSLIQSDPVLSVFRTFARLNRFSVSASLSIVSFEEFPEIVTDHAQESASQMVIVPWSSSSMAEASEDPTAGSGAAPYNPFDGLFGKSSGLEQTSSTVYSQFVRKLFSSSTVDVALFIDRGLSYTNTRPQIFLPFFGGPDDRLALSFVVQLCTNESIRASVVRIRKTDLDNTSSVKSEDTKSSVNLPSLSYGNTMNLSDTIYAPHNTQTRLQSETADNILWSQLATSSSGDSYSPDVASALTRITFTEELTLKPLHRTIELAIQHSQSTRPLFVVAGRSRCMGVESHQVELRQLMAEKGISVASEAPRTLGDVAAAFVAAGANVSLVVLQACS